METCNLKEFQSKSEHMHPYVMQKRPFAHFTYPALFSAIFAFSST